jgi:hypothetical protein
MVEWLEIKFDEKYPCEKEAPSYDMESRKV